MYESDLSSFHATPFGEIAGRLVREIGLRARFADNFGDATNEGSAPYAGGLRWEDRLPGDLNERSGGTDGTRPAAQVIGALVGTECRGAGFDECEAPAHVSVALLQEDGQLKLCPIAQDFVVIGAQGPPRAAEAMGKAGQGAVGLRVEAHLCILSRVIRAGLGVQDARDDFRLLSRDRANLAEGGGCETVRPTLQVKEICPSIRVRVYSLGEPCDSKLLPTSGAFPWLYALVPAINDTFSGIANAPVLVPIAQVADWRRRLLAEPTEHYTASPRCEAWRPLVASRMVEVAPQPIFYFQRSCKSGAAPLTAPSQSCPTAGACRAFAPLRAVKSVAGYGPFAPPSRISDRCPLLAAPFDTSGNGTPCLVNTPETAAFRAALETALPFLGDVRGKLEFSDTRMLSAVMVFDSRRPLIEMGREGELRCPMKKSPLSSGPRPLMKSPSCCGTSCALPTLGTARSSSPCMPSVDAPLWALGSSRQRSEGAVMLPSPASAREHPETHREP